MKMFELNGRKRKNGRRPFKMILHEVYPDNCVVDKVGTQFNENGICWIAEYCENNIDTIKGMSLTCEFADPEQQDELLGHGDTGYDGDLPVFDNATIVGNFEKGYIADVEIDGVVKKVVVGEGTIDQMRCNNFVKYLEEQLNSGDAPHGSVEISKCVDRDGIVYLNGKIEEGRIPTIFDYSGYSLLGVRPADQTATILELNKSESEVDEVMNEELKNALQEIVNRIDETNACKEKVKEIEAEKEQLENEKNEAVESSANIQKALDEVKAEYEALNQKYDALWEERNALEKKLGEALARERLGELNSALSVFTEEQIAYAKSEKEAFEADPMNSEINSVVDKIYIEIGKRTAEEMKTAEINSANEEKEADDIFCEINSVKGDGEIDIFN